MSDEAASDGVKATQVLAEAGQHRIKRAARVEALRRQDKARQRPLDLGA